jgi:two-component sensor histidine kinase
MKNKSLIILFVLHCIAFSGFSQSSTIDSLEALLKRNTEFRAKLQKTTFDKSDTQRVNILNSLSQVFINKANYEKAQTYIDEVLKIAPNISFKRGEYEAYQNMGICYIRQGDFPAALNNLSVALKIAEQIKYKQGLAKTTNNIAIVYSMQSNFPEALKNNLAALKIREELGDKKGIADSYNNIGKVYTGLGNDKEALKYHLKALKIREELGDKRGLLSSYINFGNIYNKQSKFEEALKNYFAARQLCEELGEKFEQANLYMNIGAAYNQEQNGAEAVKYNLKAMQVHKTMGNKYGVAQGYINAANSFQFIDKYSEAKTYLDSAIELSKDINALDLTRNAYKMLYEQNTETERWQDAFQNYIMYIMYRDSIINEDNLEQIAQTQMQYELDKKDLTYQKELALKAVQLEFQKKQAAAKSKEEKKQLIYEQKIKEQQINFEYNQKIAKVALEQQQQIALNKVLSKENQLMSENSKNETIIRWLMLAAMLGFTAFGINFYRSYKHQQTDNKQIKKQAEDLKTLMKELHHRVKNNLQLIVAMLRMQHRTIEDKAAIDALINSENRLHAIAMVHEKLYTTENITSVLLKDYLQELIDVLAKQFHNTTKPIQYKIVDNTNFSTTLDTAIPIGLIVNELVTNSLKHAFTSLERNEIHLEISRINNKYQLIIQDNGKGLPNGQLPKNPNTLGLRLVSLFTDQLNGTLHYSNNGGACFTILFA